MLKRTASGGPGGLQVASPLDATQLDVIELSDHAVSSPASVSEDQRLLKQTNGTETPVNTPEKGKAAPSAPQTKVLFLDGARGLAAMLVVVQHSNEFMPDLHLGSVGVDVFFVLSSFLLTWIFMKKSMKLLAQGASLRTWAFTMADYFQKRFFRVYPLFFVTVIMLSFMTTEDQKRYFVGERPSFEMFKTLTFEYEYRYHVFWTLPLEISYYFVIPILVLAAIGMKRFWWVPAVPLTVWIVHEGIYTYRASHMPMRPHISTFLTGSLAALVFVKLDLWIKKTKFTFGLWHTLVVRAVEAVAISMLLSVCFRGELFHWVHENPAPPPQGFPYISAFLAIIFVIEMVHPSCVSTALEWSVLRFWGKISFSIYLMHSFVIYNPTVNAQHDYFDRFFSRLILILAISTGTYYLVEYPSQLLTQRVSKYLAAEEKKGSTGRLQLTPHFSMNERSPLLPRTSTVEEARARNLGKRVKLHSKRLRQIWPRIAVFFTPRDIVGLGSTCRRLQQLLDNDRVWYNQCLWIDAIDFKTHCWCRQTQYDRVLNQHVTRLLLPHFESRFDNDLPTKEKLRRVIHARHVHDPTNALQIRLREAEREVFRLKLRQHKVRSVVWMNVPLVLALCCLSVWSYSAAALEGDNYSEPVTPSPQLRGAGNSPANVSSVKTFVVVADLLLLIAVMVLGVSDLTGKALYTVGVLVAIETAVMLAEFVAWSSSLQVAHSFLVLAILVFNTVLVTKENKEYVREMAAFLPSY
ncbi:putative O-acetyltransferase [Phytophthora citrophthora]|uniref:O-acetyltransferase n=1 Tax=Phytophthora citrophthora TaxID=4793 RepID=A0AAD9GAX0_9STRA|nr:putative O-acetyltransferase [Phytophthora citrophthora]